MKLHQKHNLYFLFWTLFVCLILIACGGDNTEQNNDEQNQTPPAPECYKDSDCSLGYICSDTGKCVVPEATPEPSTPSACIPEAPTGSVLYVATDGIDTVDRSGSQSEPYATITFALDQARDGTTILVKPGLYTGRVRIRGTFANGVTVRSEVPYMARLRNNDRVLTAYTDDARGCNGITIEGFDIAHSGPGAEPLVFHLDAGGAGHVSNITIRNNVLHDSYNNDILKINHGIRNITVERNLFYNQTGSDEHIDINSAEDITVQDNIFMNDFAGSGRTNGNDTSSYIVVKDSNGDEDQYLGSRNIKIRRNIFLNWEGSTGNNFVLLGEDGQNFFEADGVTIENNLMIGNSANDMRAPFGIKGCRNVTFNNNTIVGDLPALAFAMRFNREGDNPVNSNIQMYNNIWSDPTGTMGARAGGGANDFSDTPLGHTENFTLNNNLFWNGGSAIPEDASETINISDDAEAVVGNPELADQAGLLLPRWNAKTHQFNDGSATICEAFETLVLLYGLSTSENVIDQADADHAPADDILGNIRDSYPDMGAVEVQ